MTDKGVGGIIDDILGEDNEGEGRGWHGDSEGHSAAAKQRSNSAGSKGGTSRHQLTDEERSKGGKASAAKQNMSELGRKGGSK